MSKAKRTAAATSESGEYQDLEMVVPGVQDLEAVVSDVEKTFASGRGAQLVDFIGPTSEGVLTLFPFKPRNPDEEKVYPVMKGYLDTRDVKVQVSAFLHMSDEGRQFLSLSIGKAGEEHIGGVLFRQENQDAATGMWTIVPGKENERSGWIDKQVKNEETGEYTTVFRLNASGSRRMSRAGAPFIKVRVYPVPAEQSISEDAMMDCF